jgi:hypothetical protein
LSEWIADLKAAAPVIRNGAAYEIASMGPAAVAAVPALIEALDDPAAVVRFPVTVALGEIGPGAAAAVPRLKQMMEEELNDEIAASARRAIRRIQPSALAGEKAGPPVASDTTSSPAQRGICSAGPTEPAEQVPRSLRSLGMKKFQPARFP